MQIKRFYDNLDKYIKPGRVLVIYGPRQIGKTTLIKSYLKRLLPAYPNKYDAGENLRVANLLSSRNFEKILPYIGQFKLYVLDEAQKVPDIGTGLKIIVDNLPKVKVVATGSSSFELAGQVGEPLAGRKRTLILFPFSQMELKSQYGAYELQERLPEWLIFGSYPAVLTAKSRKEKIEEAEEIIHSYLLKDILELEQVKSSKVLLDLLKLLAFQIGGEVSLSELGRQLGIDYKTIARYLDLFEKSFVLFSIRGFSKNLRKEVTKKSKYYFYDNGVRNAVISQFNDLEDRNDIGQLWENFLVVERLKLQEYKGIYANNYFWRTWDKQEVDWVEERGGILHGYEFKWKTGKKKKEPKDWPKTYDKTTYEIINRQNYLDFVS